MLRWPKASFDALMMNIQMPSEYGAIYPQEGDTDAPAGYVTMWSNFFGVCNLRLPLTVFVAKVLECYKLHISLLSPFGMIRVRNFEYTFRALGIEPTGLTKWKTKFFYIKVANITARLTFRNVTDPIIPDNISVPKADTMNWFLRLQTIGWKKLSNLQLWVLQMMLGRMSRKARPVVPEKVEDAPHWGMFFPDFKGKVEVLACVDGEERFNHTIRDNFRLFIVGRNAGDLGALRVPDATGVAKQYMEKHGDKRFFTPKKPHEPIVVPPLVPEVADGGAAAGGSSVGSKPATDKKRKGDVAAAGGQKGPKLRRTRTAAI
ncbi:hypothetical protein Hanom_Chr00s000083g01619211 [Helianthus anomalus]